MAEGTAMTGTLKVAELSQRKPNRFRIVPDAQTLQDLAGTLDLVDLRKVLFEGEVTSEGRRDWRLKARLGATVIQPCVATLAPVTTRIDTPVSRLYVAGGLQTPQGEEIAMPEDDTLEPLGEVIDLDALLHEELSLALPAYPRATAEDPLVATAAPKGAEPLTDEKIKPFAGLAELRKKMEKDD
ncbi:YceD family protein [Roseovarius sp. CH_XMU1461]|uniref:YceD family protein n=1 Tax=Roseovarius sp. CH_XMU1461 TaxID=3107777 RepID=UPI00300B656A